MKKGKRLPKGKNQPQAAVSAGLYTGNELL